MATQFVTVSIEIMHDQNLNQSQKFILAEIEQLSQLDKGCIASNKHFAELIGITKENVSRNINDLRIKGYIDIEIVPGSRNHTRIISITKIVRPPYQNSKTPLLKQQETKENKTINKTINSAIEYLNLKANKRFNNKSKDAQLLKQLIKQNYTLEDFKLVIDHKVYEWLNDTEMKKFLRPSTLFGSKFDRYLNEAIPQKKVKRLG